jgi:hypothetical protein
MITWFILQFFVKFLHQWWNALLTCLTQTLSVFQQTSRRCCSARKAKSVIWFCTFHWGYIATAVTYFGYLTILTLYCSFTCHVAGTEPNLTSMHASHNMGGFKCILQRNALLLITLYFRRPHIATIITSTEVTDTGLDHVFYTSVPLYCPHTCTVLEY